MIYGAIYSTLPQYELVLYLIYLANPKSANLALPSESIKIFYGFISLYIIF